MSNLPGPYKPRGKDFQAFACRKKILEQEYYDKCSYVGGAEFKEKFPTPRHYLYWQSLFWFHYELIIKSEKWRKCINFDKHWKVAQLFERAVAACELRHELVGNPEELAKCTVPKRFFLEVSRETFKSTFADSCLMWVVAKHPDWTNLYMRYVAPQASKHLNTIATNLIGNTALHEYFPHIKIEPKQIKKRRGKINTNEIMLPVLSDDEELTYEIDIQSEANINGWGLMESYTGAHINGIAIRDDSVTADNYQSEPIQKKIVSRMGEISSNICSEQSVIIDLGTPYSDEDALQQSKAMMKELQKDEDVAGSGVTVAEYFEQPLLEYPGHDREQLLKFILHPENEEQKFIGELSIAFPEKHSARAIRQKYKELGKKFFYSQYLLLNVQAEELKFMEEWLTFYGPETTLGFGPKKSEVKVLGIIDPSGQVQSNMNQNDDVGILIVGIDKHPLIWTYEAIEAQLTPYKLIENIIELTSLCAVDEWYMESYALANVYRTLIQDIINSRRLNINIQPLKGNTSPGAKVTRILGARWLFEMRKVNILHRHAAFLKQYRSWYPGCTGVKDHLLDCFGWLKDKVYPRTDVQQEYDVSNLGLKSVVSNINELKDMEIRHIVNERRAASDSISTLCMNCGRVSPASSVNCNFCGMATLYRGPIEQEYAFEEYSN